MDGQRFRTGFLVLLALIFTVGLSFASVELPYLVDEAIMGAVPTPGFDSQVDEVSRVKTELFISHYHIRTIGYVCFCAVLFLIIVGFATRRSGLAALGALAFMLPVFAQFAGVMFFLAGLGLLNIVWLPVLDISFALSGLGEVIRAPYDFLRWMFVQFGLNGYWIIVYFFLGSGLLVFFLGTLAWLQARARGEKVARSWVYRISRHPQYLGWIIWTYGLFILILSGQYPRRSWGISASLPWLLSTLVIIGVAMIEEINMRREHGEDYDSYRRSAPFLFPLPSLVESAFFLPFRFLIRGERIDRGWQVALGLGLYGLVLVAASFLFYGNGMERVAFSFKSDEGKREYVSKIVGEVREEENWRRQSALTRTLADYGEPGVDGLVALLQDQDPELREYAASTLTRHPSDRALDALAVAVRDPAEDVRWHSAAALGSLGDRRAIEALLPVLEDSVSHVRLTALRSLASLGAEEVGPMAMEMTRAESFRERVEGLRALTPLGPELGLAPALSRLSDPEAWVREEAVIALLRMGSSDAVPALEAARTDPDRNVRVYAAEAVKRLQ